MIKVKYEKKDYVFLPKKSIWVNQTNSVVRSPKKLEALRQVAIDAGFTDVDFSKPEGELDKYMQMIEDETPKVEDKPKEQKLVKKKRNPRLKSPTAVSLSNVLKF